MKEQRQNTPKWIVYDSFNLNSKKDFPSFFKILQKFREGKLDEVKEVLESIDFNTQVKQISSLNKELKSITKKPRKSKADKEELNKKQERIKELNSRIKELNEENRKLKLQSFKSNIDSYRKVLKTIRNDLTTFEKDEPHFQTLLTENKWIFGPWYEDVLPKRKADTANEPDFVLKRFDGFADIVEIEAPGKELFTKPDRSKKSQPRSELIQAFSQIIDYIDSYNEAFKDEFYKDAMNGIDNPLNPYRPKGIVIIGRFKKSEKIKLRQLNSFLNHVSIITYDEFIRNSESMLDFIEKKKL
jgi:hypothetical protein